MRPTRRKPVYKKPAKCFFCEKKQEPDYKKPDVLKDFISDRAKILQPDRTGICQKHQRKLSKAIKRARFLALLPFTVRATR